MTNQPKPLTKRNWIAEIDMAYAHLDASDNLLRALAIEMMKELDTLERQLAETKQSLSQRNRRLVEVLVENAAMSVKTDRLMRCISDTCPNCGYPQDRAQTTIAAMREAGNRLADNMLRWPETADMLASWRKAAGEKP